MFHRIFHLRFHQTLGLFNQAVLSTQQRSARSPQKAIEGEDVEKASQGTINGTMEFVNSTPRGHSALELIRAFFSKWLCTRDPADPGIPSIPNKRA